MSGPWDDYAVSQDGPWNDYAPQKPQYGNNEVLADGTRAPVGSPEAQAARSPTAGNNFLQNATLGVGSLYTGALLGMKQMYAQATGGDPNAQTDLSGDTAAQRQNINAPINSTWGGRVGEVAGAVPLAFLPGANLTGAAALGGTLGALQPTTEGQSRLLNTGVGAATGLAGGWLGNKFTGYLTQRAAQPFIGWKPSTVDSAAVDALGVSGNAPTQDVLAVAKGRFNNVFAAARNPNVSVPLGQSTMDAFDTAASTLNSSRQNALLQHADVSDLLNSATTTGATTAKKLGDISTSLRQDAIQNLTTEGGDRALGKSLMAMREHVEDLIQGSIQDPAMAQAYAAARPQYRDFLNLTHSPTILNSATGRVNATALGKYLQGADETGYMLGGNKSMLYQAARWGQATGEGKGPPPLLKHFGLDWAGYRALNNPISNAVGGATARLGAPIAPQLGIGLQGLASGSTAIALPYLEQ